VLGSVNDDREFPATTCRRQQGGTHDLELLTIVRIHVVHLHSSSAVFRMLEQSTTICSTSLARLDSSSDVQASTKGA
jgi:hypothetical protein